MIILEVFDIRKYSGKKRGPIVENPFIVNKIGRKFVTQNYRYHNK